jgi:hypothetical protein
VKEEFLCFGDWSYHCHGAVKVESKSSLWTLQISISQLHLFLSWLKANSHFSKTMLEGDVERSLPSNSIWQ